MGMPTNDFLYEKIANDIAELIQQGSYMSNDRLPSLRKISHQYRVSVTTAIKAFQCLEERAFIEARPKSGYFVSTRNDFTLQEPHITAPLKKATEVSVGQLAMSLIQEARSSQLIKLGAAVPGPELLPRTLLARTAAGVVRRYAQEAIYYEDATGNLSLRRQISRLMRLAGCRVTADEILITNGCLEALTLALRAVSHRGDTIAIESPTYFGILQVIESLGMRAYEIATHPRTGIDINALKAALERRKISACLLMPCFNNPLGSCMPESHKQAVVNLLSEANIPLIEDDIYGPLGFQQPRPKAAKAYDQQHNVLYCSSFSKTIAPGYRLGWLIAGRYREKTNYLKFLDNVSTATLPQLVFAEFLSKNHYGKIISQSVNRYQQRMSDMRYWVHRYFPEGTRISNPQGGFVIWVELPEKVNCLQLYKKSLDQGIAISPGTIFTAQARYQHHIRMSCGAVEGEVAHQAIKMIGQIARDMKY